MRKVIIVITAVILGAVAAVGVYLVQTEKMMWQTPALVHEDAKVTFVIGDVTVKKSEDSDFEHLLVGEKVLPGYIIRTDEGSMVDIRFHRDMAVRITENSRFTLDDNTIKRMELKLSEGSLYGRFKKLYEDHSLRVRTVNSVAAIRGTELGFEIQDAVLPPDAETDAETGADNENSEDGNTDVSEETTNEVISSSTRVYALSGITEVYNPEYREQKVLVSYQKQIDLFPGHPAGDTKDISSEDISRIRKILNSLHFQEVLLISDKILFKSGSAKILDSSHEELDKIVKMLQEKRVTVRIEGHTDSIGSDAENQELSLARAESIKEYLVENGINEKRLVAAGFGESNPVTDNSTKEKRAKNRRVEFIVIDE